MNHIREEIDLVKESLKIESDKVIQFIPNYLFSFFRQNVICISAYYGTKYCLILLTDFFSLNQNSIIKFSELYL